MLLSIGWYLKTYCWEYTYMPKKPSNVFYKFMRKLADVSERNNLKNKVAKNLSTQ